MNKKVIYTSTFPHKNKLEYFLFEPEVVPSGYDFVIFTDNVDFKSNIWDIRLVPPLYTDGARSAKRYKTLPHRYLKEYDESIWILKLSSGLKIDKLENECIKNYFYMTLIDDNFKK